MRFVFTADVHEFAERTRPLFAARIECNVHATVLGNTLAGHHPKVTPVLAIGLDSGGDVGFAALRTAPWFMLATELGDPAAAMPFVERWLEVDPDLPGVNAVPGTARAIAGAWSEWVGGRTRCRAHEAIHVLDRVSDSLRPAPGELRPVTHSERPLMVEWMRAFSRENGTIPADQAETMVDAPLARGALMVWDDHGPVSIVAFSPAVSGVVRIGPVYTPPEHRRRGYATNMVAEVSRLALVNAADRCMLYTDLANPTSNKIYAEIGYRRVGDWEEHAFERR